MMKKIFLVLSCVALGVCSGGSRCAPGFSVPMGGDLVAPAFAGDSSHCELIRDSDGRHYCRAVSLKKPIYCESIKDSDMRHYCRAMVHGRPIYCESIKKKDTRQLCRALVGRD